MNTKQYKILVAGHDLKFFRTFLKYGRNYSNIEWILDEWDNHTIHDEKVSLEKLKHADIVFCEWGLGNILFFSNHVQPDQRLYVRIHLQELRVPYLLNVNWKRVDGLFFVAEWVRDDFSKKVWDDILRKEMLEKSHYVSNVVDPAEFVSKRPFPLDDRKLNFGMLGAVMKRKGHLKAVQLYHKVLNDFPHETGDFFIQGHRPHELKWMPQEDKDYEKALLTYIQKNKIAERVHFLPHGDPLSFFNSIDITVSMSDFESFHYSIPDGMLMGCLPMIRNWRGAERFYPSKYIFETDDQFEELYASFFESIDPILLYQNRSYIIERFGPSKVIPRLFSLMGIPIKPHARTLL